MSRPNTIVEDLLWLSNRWQRLFPELRQPTKSRIESLVGEAESQEMEVREQFGLVSVLAQSMGLRRMKWSLIPDEASLPMLGYVAGCGWGLVVGRLPDGAWQFETTTRPVALAELPKGCFFSTMSVNSRRTERAGTAREIFWRALEANKRLFAWVAVAALTGNLLALAGSIYSMQVYDRVIPTQNISTLVVLMVGALLAAFLELVIRLVRSGVLEHSIQTMDLAVSHQIFERLLQVRMDQFPASVGTLSGQVRSYESIRSFMSAATLYFAVDAPFALLFVVFIAYFGGALMAAVPLVFLVSSIAVGLYLRRRVDEHAAASLVCGNRKLGLLVETVENAEAIKSLGAGWDKIARWDVLERAGAEESAQIRSYTERANYIAAFMQQASYILLVSVGAYLAVTSNTLTVGALIACSILSGRVLGPMAMLPGLMVQWANSRGAMGALEKLFALELDNHDVMTPLVPQHLDGDYRVADLSFLYAGRTDGLRIAKLNILPGEKIAILGSIGSGKSTLLKILAGLYQPKSGRVLLGGLDIQQISRAHLSECIAYIPQDMRLMAGTLRHNLLMGLQGVGEAQLIKVCQHTGLSALISSQDKGFDLEIAEGGAGVSGGQKQLIALTRALLRRPSVWLLDEPTASMDDATEARCLQALQQTMTKEQTLIVVTHKPALLELVDRVIVLGLNGVAVDKSKDEFLRLVVGGLKTPPNSPVSGTGSVGVVGADSISHIGDV